MSSAPKNVISLKVLTSKAARNTGRISWFCNGKLCPLWTSLQFISTQLLSSWTTEDVTSSRVCIGNVFGEEPAMVSVRRSENVWKLVTWNEVWCLKLQRKLTFIFQIGLSQYTAFSFRMNIGLNLSWKMYSPHNKLINVLKKHLQQMQANPGELFWPGSSMPTCSQRRIEDSWLMIRKCWRIASDLKILKNLWKYATDFSIVKKLCGYRSAIKASPLFERQHICGESICGSKISI